MASKLSDHLMSGRVCSHGATLAVIIAISLLTTACAGTGTGGGLGSDSTIAGDEKGGKLVGGLKEGGTPAAMSSVTAHCAKYNKKAFVTQMESPAQGGALAFVCLDR